jgi:O-antigen/teichoic acid export membrane protein
VLVFGVILSIMAFVFNLILIPAYGILGAAIASFLAFAVYNVSKLLIVLNKFKMQPFTLKTVYILFFTASLTAIFYFWEFPFHPILNIILKSIIVTAIYGFVALRFRFSEDINLLVRKYIKI